MNKTRRQVNLGNDATWKTLTPCFSQCLKKSVCWEHISEKHHDGSQCDWWRWCVPRERNRTEEYGLDDGHSSGAVHVQTQWPGDDTSVEVFSVHWWTADTRRPRAPVPMPHCRIQFHWRQKGVIPSHRLSLTTHSCREHRRKPFWRTERRYSEPSALFDDTLMPITPQKPVLANRKALFRAISSLWRHTHAENTSESRSGEQYLDPFATRHCRTNWRGSTCVGRWGIALSYITWPHGFPTYQEICALYCDYVSRYVGPAIVVFDGYRIPSTKYTTHQRLTGGKVGIEVTFTGYMKVTMSKDVFLSNVANKQNFIDMLTDYLQLAGCLTEHAKEDADLLIAQTAVQSAATKNTVIVVDDTDLVILLCYYADPYGFALFMQCSTRGTTKKNRIWDINVTQSEFIHAILGCDTTSRL